MPRTPRPWYRAAADAWYTTVGGKQHLLAKGKSSRAEAYKVFNRLMAEGGPDGRPKAETVAVLCDLFLDHSQRSNRPSTYAVYRRHLQSFVESCGTRRTDELRPLDVSRWVAAHPGWSDSSRNLAISSVKRVYSWAEQEGIIDHDPIRRMRKPPIAKRDRLLSAAEVAALEGGISDQCFRDFFAALVESGCRPGEAAQVEAKDVDLDAGTWTMEFKGNRRRVVYLTPRLIEICRRLMAEHPTGPIFRNRAGVPWTRHGYAQRMRRLRRKLGLGEDVTAYLIRHFWATEGLDKGVPIATVAELLGHKDTKMLSRHYSHLREKRDHLRDALAKIRPPGEPGASGASGSPGAPPGGSDGP